MLKSTYLALITNFIFAFPSMVYCQGHAHHQHAPAAATNDSKNNSADAVEKFKPDESLKSRMNTIKKTMTQLHAKDIKQVHVIETGNEIKKTVNDIFKNCKLDAKADEAIHPVLADLLDGAELLKQGKTTQGHAKIHSALAKYDQIFSL